ncbi:MAG: Stp1/IreP family PP2C-type Ser/Thr phosphatase [Candidatus Latescibacterota bacterium]
MKARLQGVAVVQIDASSRTDTGKVRQQNEDSCGSFVPSDPDEREKKGVLYIVADGMGGHRGGEVASRLAVATIRAHYYSNQAITPAAALAEAFQEANRLIYERSQSDETLIGMGTTCTAMLIIGQEAFFAHVGDSRAYLSREGALRQITEDHSLVGEMLRAGLITREDARTHPQRNVITKSLGVQKSVQADHPSTPFVIESGDVFLLCSDGLTALVSDDDIKSALGAADSNSACSQLIDLANQKGGLDNITVQVIRIEK